MNNYEINFSPTDSLINNQVLNTTKIAVRISSQKGRKYDESMMPYDVKFIKCGDSEIPFSF